MSSPLRLLHLMGAKKAGGAETFFIRLMVALHKRKDVTLLPIVRAGSWAAKRLTEEGIPHKTAPFGGWWDNLWSTTRKQVQALADDVKPHTVTSWMNRAAAVTPQGPWVTIGRQGGYYDLKYYANTVRYIVGNTQDIVDTAVKNGWPPNRVAVLPNFIPLPPKGWKTERKAVRQRYEIPPNATVLLVAGRLHANKGVDTALEALTYLPDNVWLLIVGEGPLRDDLKGLALKRGVAPRVVWTGWQDSVSPVAAAADMWLVPSRFEPLGNTVLDAWAHGLPVVATRTAGPAGLIGKGQGVLTPIDDVRAMAKAIQSVLDNPKQAAAIAKAGHAEYLTKFSEEVVVMQWLGYYKARLQRKNG